MSWGSDVESSPLLGDGRAEERGVSGVTVSSNILRSCCGKVGGNNMWVNTRDSKYTVLLDLKIVNSF